MESGEFSVLAVCFEAEGDDVCCTLFGRVFSFCWAESFIGEEMDEALVHLGETRALGRRMVNFDVISILSLGHTKKCQSLNQHPLPQSSGPGGPDTPGLLPLRGYLLAAGRLPHVGPSCSLVLALWP